MTGWPDQPVIYEINTAVWLDSLSRAIGRPVTLAGVAAADWDAAVPAGVDAVWLMGVCGTKPGRAGAGERQCRAAGLVRRRAAGPAARRCHRVAVLRAPLRRRCGLRRI